jgi:hypothetical protein
MPTMTRWEQFEVWDLVGDRWELAGAFGEFEVAAALASTRHTRVRLLRAAFEENKRVEEEVMVQIGETRGD